MSDKPAIRALLEDQSTPSYSLGVTYPERHNRDSIIYRVDVQVLQEPAGESVGRNYLHSGGSYQKPA